MWPWGHVAVAYLSLTGWTHLGRSRAPTARETLILGFAALLPDLIDKPLAWTFNVLPNGRSLGHSLITAIILIGVLRWGLRHWRHRSIATAFGIGYVSHLFGDAIYPVLDGEYYYTSFLLYPITPAIDYPEESTSILAHFLQMEITPLLGFEVILTAVVIGMWVRDGLPGVPPSWRNRLQDRPASGEQSND